jgi:hypothetical protein
VRKYPSEDVSNADSRENEDKHQKIELFIEITQIIFKKIE